MNTVDVTPKLQWCDVIKGGYDVTNSVYDVIYTLGLMSFSEYDIINRVGVMTQIQ